MNEQPITISKEQVEKLVRAFGILNTFIDNPAGWDSPKAQALAKDATASLGDVTGDLLDKLTT